MIYAIEMFCFSQQCAHDMMERKYSRMNQNANQNRATAGKKNYTFKVFVSAGIFVAIDADYCIFSTTFSVL